MLVGQDGGEDEQGLIADVEVDSSSGFVIGGDDTAIECTLDDKVGVDGEIALSD